MEGQFFTFATFVNLRRNLKTAWRRTTEGFIVDTDRPGPTYVYTPYPRAHDVVYKLLRASRVHKLLRAPRVHAVAFFLLSYFHIYNIHQNVWFHISFLIFYGGIDMIGYIILLPPEVVLSLVTNILFPAEIVLCIANQNISEYEKWYPSDEMNK